MFGKYKGFIKFLTELIAIGVSGIVFTVMLALAMTYASII